MPRKIRQLIRDLKKAGFIHVPGGKGSQRKFVHPQVLIPAIIPGQDGDNAKHYLEKHVAQKIEEANL